MSVFGGDSWSREAQHRKRRVDDLLLSHDSSPATYKKLSNGKFACVVCPHNPILDSILAVSIHNKGSRHIASETRLKERELSRQDELNKRIALAADAGSTLSSSNQSQQPKHLEAHKPLIEQTRQAILETLSNRSCKLDAQHSCHKMEPNKLSSSSYNSPIEITQNMRQNDCNAAEKVSAKTTEADGKALVNWHAELLKRQEKELKFTAAGWKRDGHGKWYKDENVEFDSDEEDPNNSLN